MTESIRKGRILKTDTPGNYLQVNLARDGKAKTVNLHSIVCATFHGPRPSPEHQAAHWDGLRDNCRSDNLRWATILENSDDKRRHGTHPSGSQHHLTTITEDQVADLFSRHFRATQGRTRMVKRGCVEVFLQDYGTTINAYENIVGMRNWRKVTVPLLKKLRNADHASRSF